MNPRFDILTLFPEMFGDFLRLGLLGKAVEGARLQVFFHDLRAFAPGSRGMIDDHPFGGGDSMVLAPEPLGQALEALEPERQGRPVIYLTPEGEPFTAHRARRLAAQGAILLCGRYAGIDERIRALHVHEEISIGDYVLMGGEVPAMVLLEAAARFIPGVLGNEISADRESFEDSLLEGPLYTRPREYRGLKVPEVLLSGDHQAIARWRSQAARQRTQARRPDLLQKKFENEVAR